MTQTDSGIRTRVLADLAEVAVQAHIEGDEHAVRQVVDYLAGDLDELATVFSIALEIAQRRATGG